MKNVKRVSYELERSLFVNFLAHWEWELGLGVVNVNWEL